MDINEQIYALIFALVPLTISLVGFIVGMANILKKKAPYYFTLIIFATGCFVVEQLSLMVNTICGIYDDVWIGTLGVFGCNFFLLSANYGALDKVVDESRLSTGKKLLSLVIPAILAASTVSIFLIWKDRNMMCAVVFALILVPAIPASYYNVKHLLLPTDDFGLLKAIRGCDIMSLVFFLMAAIYLYIESTGSILGIVVTAILHSLSIFGLALSAVKGVRQWKI